MKAALYDAMVKFGIKKFESDVLNLTLVEPTTSTSIDAAKLKRNIRLLRRNAPNPAPRPVM